LSTFELNGSAHNVRPFINRDNQFNPYSALDDKTVAGRSTVCRQKLPVAQNILIGCGSCGMLHLKFSALAHPACSGHVNPTPMR
jgi:hypothetical protein